MSISIQTNVNAMVAQENLRANTDFQSRTIERLTSGYRINSSGDDAAGLAVAIPTYAGYNYLVNRVNSIVLDMEKASTEILNIVSGPVNAGGQ